MFLPKAHCQQQAELETCKCLQTTLDSASSFPKSSLSKPYNTLTLGAVTVTWSPSSSLVLLAVHHSLVVEEHGGMVAMVVEEQQPTCVRHWTQPVTGAPRLERRWNRY